MRIHLKLTPNTEPIPFAHLHNLTGTLHKWLGKENNLHGEMSLYSFSWLKGTSKTKKGELESREGATWMISAYDKAIIKKITASILIDPIVSFGMTVKDIIIENDPEFNNQTKFNLASPILVKKRLDTKNKHLTFNEKETAEILTQVLIKKLKLANLNSAKVKVYFDKNYSNPKTKIVHYKNIKNRANICPVIVEGTPEQIAFAWNVGIGHSTGIGFGALN